MSNTKAKTTTAKDTATEAAAGVTKEFETMISANRKTLQDAFKSGAEAAEKAIMSGTEAFKTSYEKAVKDSKEQVEKATKTLGENTFFDTEGAEPFVKAGTEAAEKGEKINAELIEFGTTRVSEYFTATRSVLDADDFQKAVEVQTEYARNSIETYVSEAGKINAMVIDATKTLMEPFGSQYAANMDKFLNRA